MLCLAWEFDVVCRFRGDSLGSRAFHLGGLCLRSHSVGNTRDTRGAHSGCEYQFYSFWIFPAMHPHPCNSDRHCQVHAVKQ
ncbi:hypothetical protein ACN38_g6767 [Penicillium nordicum]|uniref:Uncharacterized protein n=1 Tax=Penicillium nordicum TaxID=229535 RepID=A0A0M8P852_9EURO|nr:hypothetical protein ACN38_g6767 [Penicillium nordicum]